MAQFIAIILTLGLIWLALRTLWPGSTGKLLQFGDTAKPWVRNTVRFLKCAMTILVSVFWIYVRLGTFEVDERTREYLTSPRIGDIYWTKVGEVPDSGYDDERVVGLMKIVSINEDSIEFIITMKAYESRRALTTYQDTIEYSQDTIQIPMEVLHTMVEEEIIELIDRD